MNFFYTHNFSNIVLKNAINKALERLFSKLMLYDSSKVDVSEYIMRYFGKKIKNINTITASLKCYSFILYYAILPIKKEMKDIVFMDYGGGHGMLSLLAKELGIGTVIYNDIYEISCIDAKKIAQSLDLEANFYIPGDIDDVISFLKKENISCDAVGNYDVIEHIYNIEEFLNKLKDLSDNTLSIFMGSGANTLNPRIRKILMKQHMSFEYSDREYKFGRKPTDETRSLFEVRREIIIQSAPELSQLEIDLLSKLTRGLLYDAIQAAVHTYLEKKILPSKPIHPTNTCDPYTGNWFEHLMNPSDLTSILKKNGFESKVVAGYYSTNGNFLKRIIGKQLNFFINRLGKNGLYISPFYVISGIKKN